MSVQVCFWSCRQYFIESILLYINNHYTICVSCYFTEFKLSLKQQHWIHTAETSLQRNLKGYIINICIRHIYPFKNRNDVYTICEDQISINSVCNNIREASNQSRTTLISCVEKTNPNIQTRQNGKRKMKIVRVDVNCYCNLQSLLLQSMHFLIYKSTKKNLSGWIYMP